jgi:hypothetical protein
MGGKIMAKKVKVKIIKDSKYGFTNNVKNLDSKLANKLIRDKIAVLYTVKTASRVVRLNGKTMTWGDYLKRRNKQRKY